MKTLNALTLCVAITPAFMAGMGTAVAADPKDSAEPQEEASQPPGGKTESRVDKTESADQAGADEAKSSPSSSSKDAAKSSAKPSTGDAKSAAQAEDKSAASGGKSKPEKTNTSAKSGQSGKGGEGQVTNMAADSLYSDDLIGRDVMSRSSYKKIGSIKNLKLNDDGQIVSMIVHVGGFLGIGAKDVAVPWSEVERKQADDSQTYMITVAKDAAALEAAPAHVRNASSSNPTDASE